MRWLGLLSFLILSCAQEAGKLQLNYGVRPENKIEGEAKETYDPRVDVLFVVDDSGSMDTHQKLLASNISIFVNKFVAAGTLDFHVGVVTTDTDDTGKRAGRLVGTPTYVENQTPNIVDVLSKNLIVGTYGSGWERAFMPVKLALTDPLLSNFNAGFYRPDAHLAVIFITDAEDQSDMTTDEFIDFLKTLKPNYEKVLAYGVVIPTGVTNCYRDQADMPPTKIEYVLGKVSNSGKNIMSLCDPNYGERLSEMTDDLLKRVGRTIYLKRRPLLGTIRLQFGTMILPQDSRKGWAYNRSENTIFLGSEIDWGSQPPGTKLKIYYDALDY